eukprot:2452661-Pleurochrysis_carterae.AAC.10
MDISALEPMLDSVKDSALKHTLAFGIGIHHAGLEDSDRILVEKLFLEQSIMVLVCTATLAWGVNFPAHLVVVKGTECARLPFHSHLTLLQRGGASNRARNRRLPFLLVSTFNGSVVSLCSPESVFRSFPSSKN